MAIVRNYKPKTVYLNSKIKNRLKSLFDTEFTVVEAPTGYGKTTTIKEFMSRQDKQFIWFDVANDDKDQFFNDFCSRLQMIDEEKVSSLRQEGYPFDISGYRKVSKLLIELNLKEKTFLILDNYHLVSSDYLNKVFKDVTSNKESKLNVVILTREIKSSFTLDLIYKGQLNYISKDDFEFTKQDIEKYCKLCGFKLESQEVDYLYIYSEGWISIVYLLLMNFLNTGKFELNESINNLVINELWEKLRSEEKEFLVSVGVLDRFSFKKALNICGQVLKESEIERILKKNEFIKYDSKKREYYIHTLFKEFLNEELKKREYDFKHSLYKKIGDWHSVNEEYFKALTYYHDIKEYELILSMNYNVGDLVSRANKNNKHVFMDIIVGVTDEIKERNARNYIAFIITLFLYNERELLFSEYKKMKKIIENSLIIEDTEKDYLLGDLKIVEASIVFNDMNKMGKCIVEAEALLKGPSKVFHNHCSLLFGCPSALHLYHNELGKLDKVIKSIDYYTPYIYKMTGGRGKGTEALMRAQVLFYRGEIDSAEILAHKAIYMAETRSQITVLLGAMTLLAKINIFKGRVIEFIETVENIKNKAEESDEIFKTNTLDLALGHIGTIIEVIDMIPEWLKKTELIENSCNIATLGYANCIYGKYLLINQEYTAMLGVSSQFIGVANIFSSLIYQIYNYIYIAIANFKIGNIEKASKFLNEAIEIAIEDKMYFPFVENYSRIEELLTLTHKNSVKMGFLKNVNSISKIFENGKAKIVSDIQTDKNYGLTKREVDVARLAALRMSNKEISDKLFIAESTVKSNLKTIFNKLGIKSRVELKNFF